MSRLRVSFALKANPRVRPLIEGTVQPEGIEFVTSVLTPADVFWRQLRFADFDVSEMSMSSLLIAHERGDDTWTALPVFPDRRFFHALTLVREGAGIERPEDLRGKRIAVPDYQQTAALWARGALQHEFGVHPTELEWYMERTPEKSHGGATGFTPPDGVRIHQIPPNRSQYDMLVDGDVDASLWYIRYPTMIDRSGARDFPPGTVRYLHDVEAEKARYFEKMQFIPFNHCYVIRTELLRREPWVAINIFDAFVRSKMVELDRAREALLPFGEAGLLPAGTAEVLQRDVFPYGVGANEAALSTLAQYSFEQGLTSSLRDPIELFAESVRDL